MSSDTGRTGIICATTIYLKEIRPRDHASTSSGCEPRLSVIALAEDPKGVFISHGPRRGCRCRENPGCGLLCLVKYITVYYSSRMTQSGSVACPAVVATLGSVGAQVNKCLSVFSHQCSGSSVFFHQWLGPVEALIIIGRSCPYKSRNGEQKWSKPD